MDMNAQRTALDGFGLPKLYELFDMCEFDPDMRPSQLSKRNFVLFFCQIFYEETYM